MDEQPTDPSEPGTAPGRPVRTVSDPNRELRIRAAWIYYVEGHTQNEVASALGVNRVTVTRLLSEARSRGEVSIQVSSDLGPLISTERRLEKKFGLKRAVVAPFRDTKKDPIRAIAAAAGPYISTVLEPNMTVGIGWGRTLHATLGYLQGRPIKNLRVVSLLGGITEAKRFNPAECAWQFAESFDAEGFLVPAPAIVDSPETRHALLERCGLDQVFQIAESSDLAIISCGGIGDLTTSYRLGHLTEAERQALEDAGAVGDVLYNFVDENGVVIEHPINRRCVSMGLERLQRVSERILVSGGPEKKKIMPASIKCLRPTILITDEQTAHGLLERD